MISSVHELSFKVHVAQLKAPSRSECEDRWSIDAGKDDDVCIAVFDGHGGAHTADWLCHELPSRVLAAPPRADAAVARHLSDAFSGADRDLLGAFTSHFASPLPSKALVSEKAIVDRLLRRPPARAACLRARAGSTALVLYLRKGRFWAANAGDSRCLRVPPAPAAGDPREAARLAAAHPGEEAATVVMQGRVLGRLATSRGFGDAYFKLPARWTTAVMGRPEVTPPGAVPLRDQAGLLFTYYKTPPYLTAEPEVATGAMEGGDGRGYLVLATDGLFDVATNEQVAESVRRAAQRRQPNLAAAVVEDAQAAKPPGDDVTVVVVEYGND